ncbi:hypothetical protein CHS0354_015255 [Potamilus streckersoni]|uniref:Uncharacterized protein n=1 Tax=Potamilus streckersoni TaxID=2493646 RepID=A0AAE0VHL1_9BIVA|nr:hypothetical protein CHS0354_015255 [Potamilus streckersoni]
MDVGRKARFSCFHVKLMTNQVKWSRAVSVASCCGINRPTHLILMRREVKRKLIIIQITKHQAFNYKPIFGEQVHQSGTGGTTLKDRRRQPAEKQWEENNRIRIRRYENQSPEKFRSIATAEMQLLSKITVGTQRRSDVCDPERSDL